MKITFVGHGKVGAPLAHHLQRAGHHVTLAAGDPHAASVKKVLGRNAHLAVAPPKAAVEAADVVFLATPFHANEEVARALAHELGGKILVDCTNPVGADLRHGLGSAHSGSEALQKLLPATRVVKAFSIYGFENFEDSAYPGHSVRPMMMYCGNDATAKKTVARLIDQLGWEPFDVGGLDQALHLEHMTLLWVRMVRVDGVSPHTVWARLRR
jgi:predicted dinucleotide-binding enzyme